MAPDFTRYKFTNIVVDKHMRWRDDDKGEGKMKVVVSYENEVLCVRERVKEDYAYACRYWDNDRILIDLSHDGYIENVDFDYMDIGDKRITNITFKDCKVDRLEFHNCLLRNVYFENCEGDVLFDNCTIDNVQIDHKSVCTGYIVQKKKKVYKKAYNPEYRYDFSIPPKKEKYVIVTLELIPGSIVFSINNKKCRTNKIKVIAIDGKTTKGLKAESACDSNFVYEVGKEIEIKDFDCRYNIECSTGIHFFNTKKEAEEYQL